ncbi:hypothetical protein ABNF97_09330 [Plantactinospora sp. B6F1]
MEFVDVAGVERGPEFVDLLGHEAGCGGHGCAHPCWRVGDQVSQIMSIH